MENFRSWIVVLGIAFVAGLIGGIFGNFVDLKNIDGRLVEEHAYIEDSKIIDAIDEVMPAVVSVVSTTEFSAGVLKNVNPEDVYGGTGFIVDSGGLILTNKHVVADKSVEYKAVLNDGTQYPLEILSEDPIDDISVLKIVSDTALDLPVVEFGDSDDLKIGQRVIAIGNALAVYGNTVTSGIISAKGRDVLAYNDFGDAVQNMSGLIQTDAAINLGNSGGPLINLDGQVIGMNAALAESANNIGFAIPINDIKPVLESIKKNGKIIRPVLGVNFLMLDKVQAGQFDASLGSGALLIDGEGSKRYAVAPNSAAMKAGLREMDIILSVDDVEVNMDKPLHKIIRTYNPGDTITLNVWRDGKVIEIEVVLR